VSTEGFFSAPRPSGSGGYPTPVPSGSESALRIVWIYPDLLSTYGDRGNLLILARRARLRGIPVETIEVRSDQPLPSTADIYLLGGGEDGPQALGAQRLLADGGLHRAVAQGSVVFAVCAGYQLLGSSFFAKGTKCAGLELLDLHSDRGPSRAVGELAGEIDPRLGLPPLSGFENHGGRTHLGPGVSPLARVTTGIGNDGASEGAWHGKLLGTYAHGPALSRNPALADLLLRWATGVNVLPPLDDTWSDRLRAERQAAVAVARS
jgi:CobQ-like glutamine amidotransferase family enzyme